MSIPIHCLTAVLKKSVIEVSYPGGLSRFLLDYPDHIQDEYLVGTSFMSGGELDEFAETLRAAGFDIAHGWAVGEAFNGEWERGEGIAFHATKSCLLDRGWQAVFVGDEEGGQP